MGDVQADEGHRIHLSVPEMDCQSCVGKVTASVEAVPGVTGTEARAATGRLTVTHDGTASPDGVADAVREAGYVVDRSDADGEPESPVPAAPAVLRSPRGRRTAAGAVVLAVALALEFGAPAFDVDLVSGFGRSISAADLALLVATALAGTPILRAGAASLRYRRLDIDLLMGGGIAGAVVVGLYLEGAMIAVLFSTAELLERFAMDRARDSIRRLTDLAPPTATVRDGDEEHVVPAATVEVGDVVVVRPGERLPVDGVVVEGESPVDESPVTGESWPVTKTASDEVYAGTIAVGGYLEVEATATADESTIARIAELVADAERHRTRHERFVERFARYYTPAVVVAALLTVVVPPLVLAAPWRPWFVRGLTLLVLACPCAFVISTPVGVVSGVTAAARNGVLVKGGDYLEAMGDVAAVAIDKTGTLTTGEIAVTDVVPLGERTAADVLACARGLETRSQHPLATAIVEAAENRGVDTAPIEGFEALAGVGVRADLDGATHYAGKPELFADLGFELGHVHLAPDEGRLLADGGVAVPAADPCGAGNCIDLAETVLAMESDGKTVVLVGTEEEIEGLIAVADSVRPEAARAVARLQALGLPVVMLTGDNERTARAVADRVGIDRVRAEVLPEEKVRAVEALTHEFDGVAMVGDGVNDAPALAAADVGIAMGAAGTDAAIETADIALLGDDLLKLPYLVRLSRRATGVIRQNIAGSLGAKALLALGVPFGLVGVVEAIVIGDMGMSLGVTGNAMRLAGVAPEAAAGPSAGASRQPTAAAGADASRDR